MSPELTAAVHAVMPRVRGDLEDLVRIPSVSAEPERAADVQRSAEAVAGLLTDAGFPDVRIVSEGGAPAVIARYPAPEGAPTVLLYAHHDVQPSGDAAEWNTDPFEPTERGDRLYGRGAADDKAGIAAHLAAFLAHGGAPPVGVTVFAEGEEEVGSDSLSAILGAHRDLLASDVIVIADSGNWDIGVPALTTSLRGIAEAIVEVRTLEHAVHQGMFGGAIPDALMVLIRTLASLHDDQGEAAIEGLRRGPAAELDYPEDRLRAEASTVDGVEFVGRGSLVERMWTRPSVTVLAIDAPAVDRSSNTLVPAARAKVSLRVAPGEDAVEAQQKLCRHLEEHVPWGAQVTVKPDKLGQPFAIDANGPAYDAARSAFKDAWDGVEPVDIGVGGSIPFIAEFAETYPDAAILVTGVEDPDTRAHGPNEGLHMAEFERVCVAEALLLQRLAEVK
jgi:acetylornithine deacetylase/succinyl-diaminopimelate desuccinylase-like protein